MKFLVLFLSSVLFTAPAFSGPKKTPIQQNHTQFHNLVGKTWLQTVRVLIAAEKRQNDSLQAKSSEAAKEQSLFSYSADKTADAILAALLPNSAWAEKKEKDDCLRAGYIGKWKKDSAGILFCAYPGSAPEKKYGSYASCNPAIFPEVGTISYKGDDKTLACAKAFLKTKVFDDSKNEDADKNVEAILNNKQDGDKSVSKLGAEIITGIQSANADQDSKTQTELFTGLIDNWKSVSEFSCTPDGNTLRDKEKEECKEATDGIVALGKEITKLAEEEKKKLEKAPATVAKEEEKTQKKEPTAAAVVETTKSSCDQSKTCSCKDTDKTNPLNKLQEFGKKAKGMRGQDSCFRLDLKNNKQLILKGALSRAVGWENNKGFIECKISCGNVKDGEAKNLVVRIPFTGDHIGANVYRLNELQPSGTVVAKTKSENHLEIPETCAGFAVNSSDGITSGKDIHLALENIGLGDKECLYSRGDKKDFDSNIEAYIRDNGKGPKQKRLQYEDASDLEFQAVQPKSSDAAN